MAQYRLAVNVIGRSAGRSATAAAAYRAGAKILDERTGILHDYSRKQGVTHSEIIAPDDAPDWMRDRAQLWNAVEAAEKRRDAQLVRELQLSLPHELTHEQRVNLVRGFVREQHVSRGMVADIAIHAPDQHELADQRNHHAHVMLTMRELVGGQFGRKARDWNDKDVLQDWREAWAEHQNREFKRLGLPARVSHKSLSDQGIEREPQKHLGPIATEIERDGRASHRGNENRAIHHRNGMRHELREAANDLDGKIAFERRKYAAWATQKREKLDFEREKRMAQFQVGLAARMLEFERQLDAEFAAPKEGLSRAHSEVAARLEVGGWRKFVRDITLTTRRDKRELEALERQATEIAKAEELQRQQREQAEENRRRAIEQAEAKKAADLERGIEKGRQRVEERLIQAPPPLREDFTETRGEPHRSAKDQFNKAARGAQEAAGGDQGDSGGKTPPAPQIDARAAYIREQQQSAAPPPPTPEPKPEPTQAPASPDKADYIRQQQEASRSNDNAPSRDERSRE